VGALVGWGRVGLIVGCMEGSEVTGMREGDFVGATVVKVGATDGICELGAVLGDEMVGDCEGLFVGEVVGLVVGLCVGGRIRR